MARAVLVIASASSLAVTATILVAPSASAQVASLGVTQYRVGGTQVQFSICLTADYEGSDQALPARLEGTYTVSLGGSVIRTTDWSNPDPTAVLLYTESCPSVFVTLAVDDLQLSQTYTIAVSATLSPKVENDDGDYVADTSRSTITLSRSLTASTTDGLTAGGESGGSGGSTSGGSTGGTSGSGSTSGGSTGGTSGSGSSDGGSTGGATPGTAEVVIEDPARFTVPQLSALTPEQVATIDAATFGQLPPRIFAALTPEQAATLTLAQASSIRPARAAELRPDTVAALPPATIAAMRPAAIKSLSLDAIKAMTRAQLRALTPRQIAALRPLQLAELTVAEKALLRRR